LLTHTLHRFIHTRHRLTHTFQRFTQGHACVYARRHRHAHTGRLRARRRRRSQSTAAAVRTRRSRVNFSPRGSIFRRPSARRSRGRSDVWPSLSCLAVFCRATLRRAPMLSLAVFSARASATTQGFALALPLPPTILGWELSVGRQGRGCKRMLGPGWARSLSRSRLRRWSWRPWPRPPSPWSALRRTRHAVLYIHVPPEDGTHLPRCCGVSFLTHSPARMR